MSDSDWIKERLTGKFLGIDRSPETWWRNSKITTVDHANIEEDMTAAWNNSKKTVTGKSGVYTYYLKPVYYTPTPTQEAFLNDTPIEETGEDVINDMEI